MDKIQIQLVLKNHLGEFIGNKSILTKDQYNNVLTMAKSFYNNGGFELTCEDGTFIVFPPDIVKQSILQIKKIKKEDV